MLPSPFLRYLLMVFPGWPSWHPSPTPHTHSQSLFPALFFAPQYLSMYIYMSYLFITNNYTLSYLSSLLPPQPVQPQQSPKYISWGQGFLSVLCTTISLVFQWEGESPESEPGWVWAWMRLAWWCHFSPAPGEFSSTKSHYAKHRALLGVTGKSHVAPTL